MTLLSLVFTFLFLPRFLTSPNYDETKCWLCHKASQTPFILLPILAVLNGGLAFVTPELCSEEKKKKVKGTFTQKWLIALQRTTKFRQHISENHLSTMCDSAPTCGSDSEYLVAVDSMLLTTRDVQACTSRSAQLHWCLALITAGYVPNHTPLWCDLCVKGSLISFATVLLTAGKQVQ